MIQTVYCDATVPCVFAIKMCCYFIRSKQLSITLSYKMAWFVLELSRNSIPCPRTFVETGSYYGDGIHGLLNMGMIDTIHSIELSPELVKHCRTRFAGYSNKVHIHEGDSAAVLATLPLPLEPVTFYLDAHFSGGTTAGADIDNGCPVLRELQIIAGRNVAGDLIFIDDMRLMGKDTMSGVEGTMYPPTRFDFRHVTEDAIKEALGKRDIKYMGMCTGIDRLLIVLG